MPRIRDIFIPKMQAARKWLALMPPEEREEAAIKKIAGTETLLDISEKNVRLLTKENEALRKAAFSDELTGLTSRRYLSLMAPILMEAATPEEPSEDKTQKNSLVAVFIDVNGLGRINKDYGHDFGDALLCAAADALKHHFRRVADVVTHSDKEEILARKGGDEIILMLPDTSIKFIEDAMEEINKSTSVELHSSRIDVRCSFGYSIYTGQTLQEMYDEADANMTAYKKTAPKSQVTEIRAPKVA